MIIFDRSLKFDTYTTEAATELGSPWLNPRIRRFGDDWLVVDAVYAHDGDRVWYIYQRVAADHWRYVSYGVKS